VRRAPLRAPGEAAFGWMYDPAALERVQAAGVGATVQGLSLGGRLDAAAAGAS